MLRFFSLGSGSSGNSYFLFSDHFGILIDAGIGIRNIKKHFRSRGLTLDRIKAVIVTHDHADHIKALGHLSNDYHIPVYTTAAVHEGINRNYCMTTKISSDYVRVVEKDKSFCLDEFCITPFEVPHDSTDNVGYFISYDMVHFCLITDAGHATDKMAEYIRQSNYLVLEANHDLNMLMMGPYPAYLKGRVSGPKGHMNNLEAAELLAQNVTEQMRHVWLCHISEENNHPELVKKTMDSVLRSYGIIMGKDFELDVLRRIVPSDLFLLE